MTRIDMRAKQAARREARNGNIQLLFERSGDPEQTEEFHLPGELPLDVIDRLLSPEVEVGRLITTAVKAWSAGNADQQAVVLDVLGSSRDLPAAVVNGVLGCLQDVFNVLDEGNWARFRAQVKPSLNDMYVLIADLFEVYGAGLGKAFASLTSADSGGTTSKETSSDSTDSTVVVFGGPTATPGSSASDG